MQLSQLSDRAMEIRQRFADFESAAVGKVWGPGEIMQGLMVDVGDLAKLVMAKNGFRQVPDLDAKLEHELADCLWSVLVLARMYQVDLGAAFQRTMNEIEQKLAAGQGATF